MWPSGAATTTLTLASSNASSASGNSSCWRSAASSDGMPGIVNSSDIGLENAAATLPSTTAKISQPAMKSGHRRKAVVPRR